MDILLASKSNKNWPEIAKTKDCSKNVDIGDLQSKS